MKNQTIAAVAILSLALSMQLSHAQMVITYDGYSSGGAMPGSATDFYFPNLGNYPGYPTNFSNVNNGTAYSQLSSFTVSGGINGVDGSSSYSSITTPAATSIRTGDLQASGTIAFALQPGNSPGNADVGLNPSFNYNDFYVYLMYSNTGGTFADSTITLAPRSTAQNNSAFSAGPGTVVALNGTQAPLDNNTNPNTAYYLKFEVTGMGTAYANHDYVLGGFPLDLVVSATGTGSETYIGAVSFQSISEVPEPSTYVLMVGGLAFLGLCIRRKGALVK